MLGFWALGFRLGVEGSEDLELEGLGFRVAMSGF